jgi:hypothetical protein
MEDLHSKWFTEHEEVEVGVEKKVGERRAIFS